MNPEISVLLPMFNEESVIAEALLAVKSELSEVSSSFEIVCINDGSTDRTGDVLREASLNDPCVVPLELSRNFGKEAAMAAGLDLARGDAVLLMDADLQHPSHLIPEMIRAWRDGADVVNGVKNSRGKEGVVYKGMAALFNSMMGGREGGWQGASDFKVLDRQVVDALKQCPERHRFFRGLVAWVGFQTAEVHFDVAERVAGESKWSTSALVRYSLRNLLSFSALPLRLIALAGFSTLLFACLMGLWTLYRYLDGDALAGFPTVILLQLIFGGILLTSLGVMSLYLAELFEEAKQRPVYLYRQPREAAGRGALERTASAPGAEQTVLAMPAPSTPPQE